MDFGGLVPSPFPTFSFSTATAGTGSGNVTGSTADGNYSDGTLITLVASANLGSSFTGWSPAGCVDGFSLTATTTCTATFALNSYAFATVTAGTGSGDVTASTANGTYDHGTAITLVATPDAGSTFAGWSPASCVDGFSLTAATTCTATFNLTPAVTYSFSTATAGTGAGSVTGSTANGSYARGTAITLVAKPNTGSTFAGWSPAGCVNGFSLTAAATCTATFTLDSYAFSTATAGTGSGDVTGSTANGSYPSGTAITLAATPDAGSTFAGWAPAGCVDGFSLSAATTCTATFNTVPATLSVSYSGLGSVSGQGIDCGADCSETLPVGSVVPGLSATPASGYLFAGWNDPACGSDLTLNADTACAATFTAAPSGNPVVLSVSPGVGGLSATAPGLVSATVNENAGSVSITLSRGAGSSGTLVLGYTSVDGSASVGSDYLPVSGTLTWADGDSSDKVISLSVLDDTQYEGSENLQLQLSAVSGNFSLGHTALTLHIADNDTPTVACTPNSGAFNLNTGLAVPSAACFSNRVSSAFNRSGNGLMVLQNEAVNLGVSLNVDPAHAGQAAQLLLLVSYQRSGHTVWLTRAGPVWQFWRAGEPLPAAEHFAALSASLEVPVYSGFLTGLPGEFTVYAGYLLDDGTLVHDLPQPLRLSVANALVYNPATASQAPAYAYFNGETGDLHGYGNPHQTVVNRVLTSYTHIHTPALLAAGSVGGLPRQEVSPNDLVDVPAGYSADIYSVRRFTAPVRLEYIIRTPDTWIPWYPESDPLLPMAALQLGQQRALTLYHGALPSAGEYTGYVGYRLPDGRIVYNGLELMRVSVR